jgi:hypothetical protein
MSVELSRAIATSDFTKQTRIKRYDVNFGVPAYALTYKRFCFAKTPHVYYALGDYNAQKGLTTNKNWGTTGSAYDITQNGSLSYDTGYVDPTDKCVKFAGGNMTVSGVPAFTVSEVDAKGFSASIWFKLTQSFTTGTVPICSFGSGGANNGFSVYLTYSASKMYVNVKLANSVVFTSNTEIKLSDWTNVTFTISKSGSNYTFKLYQQGLEVATGTGTNYVGWTNVGTGATTFRIAVSDPTMTAGAQQFIGSMDEIGLWYMALDAQDVKKLNFLGINSTYYEPDEDFENDVVGTITKTLNYNNTVLSDSPTHFWKMETRQTVGADVVIVDEGTIAAPQKRNLKLTGYATGNYTPAILNAKNGSANSVPFSNTENSGSYGRSFGSTDTGFKVTTAEKTTDWTLEFWYRNKGYSRDGDLILGWSGIPNVERVVVYTQANKLYFYIREIVPNKINPGTNDSFNDIILSTTDIFYVDQARHVTFTYSKSTDTYTAYVDGVAVASGPYETDGFGSSNKKKSSVYGNVNPGSAGRFAIADQGYLGFQDHPGFNIGYVAIYDKALNEETVQRHFKIGSLGPYYAVTLTGGDPAQGEAPYKVSTNPYSILENETDITSYVVDYNINRDRKQMVDSGSLVIAEPWGSNIADDFFKVNTYLTIEQRYTSDATAYDSDWQSVGHFLVDGPIQRSISGEGSMQTVVSFSSPLKLLSLDLAKSNYEPDKIFVPKTVLDVSTTTTDTIAFQKSHHLGGGLTYGNWADFPSVKMWAKDFRNISDSERTLGISYLGEEIRIKGAQGSVQVLGGEGKIMFDLDYFTTPIGNEGIGSPAILSAEFYRYAQSYDLAFTKLASIRFDTNWLVDLNTYDVNAHNKTVFMKSGNAKGKIFKVKHNHSLASTTFFSTGTTNSSVALAGSTLTGWTQQLTDPLGLYAGETWRVSGTLPTYLATAKYSNYLKMKVPISIASSVPNSAVLKGIKIILRYRTDLGSATEPDINKLPLQDYAAYLSITGNLTSSDILSRNLAQKGRWIDKTTISGGGFTRDMSSTFYFGGSVDDIGMGTVTAGDIRTNLSNIAFFYALQATNNIGAGSNGQSFFADVAVLGVEFTFDYLPEVTLTDVYGNMIHPEYEGIVVNDEIQIGNFNSVEDTYRKLLIEAGFQENDPSLPFYFTLEQCPPTLAPAVPPLRQAISDNKTRLELLQDIDQNYSLPDYKIYVDENGVVRGKLISQVYGQDATIILPPETSLDYNKDGSDVNVITRVIVEGANATSVNVALNTNYSGFSSVHAYKLDNYCTTSMTSLDGQVLSQASANTLLTRIFDNSAKTPIPPGVAWNYEGINKYYGLIWNRYGRRELVKRWDFEDQALFALDIGRNGNGTSIEVDYMEITCFDHFFGADNKINQTILIYYMTEADYEAEFKKKAPSFVSQTDTTYFPPANANSWRLLVDEIEVTETTKITDSDFIDQKPVKARFFKFVCGQCQYQFPIINVDSNVTSRINFASIKIFNSSKIRASAELGVDGEFSDAKYKEIATRVRRRSEYLSGNTLLNSYDKAKDYALNELRDRIIDYSPVALTTIYPNVQLYDVVYWTNPQTKESAKYLVESVSSGMRKPCQLQLHNYNTNDVL